MTYSAAVLIVVASLLSAQQNPQIAPLRHGYESIKRSFVNAAEEMDEAGYSFRPTPAVQTFAQRVAHIADANVRACSRIKGESKNPDAASKSAKADLVAAIKASFAYCDSIFDSLTEGDLGRTVPYVNDTRPELAALWGLVVHNNEVYGTMTVYLRLKDLIPPTSTTNWDSVFANPASNFNRQPSRLLVEAIRDRQPGAAIDLGMGEGRNAIYLAQQGWRVTGVDLSAVGVSQAQAHAKQLGVALDAHVADLDKFDFGHGQWDLITLFYMHAWYHRSKLPSAQRLREALRPGGMLVIEGYAGTDVGFQTDELRHDFADFKVLRYEDVVDEADWSPGRKSRIVRFVAVKP